MSDVYVRKVEQAIAIQLKEDNNKLVLEWLDRLVIDYSFDEIKSGGQLIIYTEVGPAQAELENWIVYVPGTTTVYTDEAFKRQFELRSL